VTVQGEAADAELPPPLDHAAATEMFTELYAERFKRLTAYIRVRMPARMSHQSEDVAQDTFIRFWEHITQRNAPSGHPAGLLYAMARLVALKRMARSSETRSIALDFSDPTYSPLLNHSYAADRPDLAQLGNELDDAMEQMTEASKRWRDLHKQTHRHRINATREDAGAPEEKRVALAQFKAVDAEQAQALTAFRETCSRVASLRAELERVGGACWRSSTDVPVGITTGNTVATRYTATNCPKGHALTFETTAFSSDGYKDCRVCRGAIWDQRAGRSADFNERLYIPAFRIEEAKRTLSDPAENRNLDVLSEELGIDRTTMRRRLPDEYAAYVARLKDQRKVTPEWLSEVTAMLSDPEKHPTLKGIAKAAGAPATSIRRHLPAEVAEHQAAVEVIAGRTRLVAQQMLTSSSCLLSTEQIAKVCGTTSDTLRRWFPEECAAYVARRKAEPVGAGR
jgi:DNA-directed RNA polymerase specialized sigma24 family protein